MTNFYLIGLTGNLGTGKSTVRRMLEELGAIGIDADKLGHIAMLRGTPAWSAIVETFGIGILRANGKVDRHLLGARVFANPEELRRLESILHPAVGELIKETLRANTSPVVVLEAIKLVEANLHLWCDALWVVTATQDAQIQRVMRDRNMRRDDARTRLTAQGKQDDKQSLADVIIDNSYDLSSTRMQVQNAWRDTVRPDQAGNKSEWLFGKAAPTPELTEPTPAPSPVAPAPEPAPSPALEPISSPEPEPVPSPEPEIKPEELPAEPSAELPPVAEPEIKAEELLVEPPTELQLTEPEPMPGVNGAQAFEAEDSGEGTPSPVAQVPEPATEEATPVIESADVTPTEVVAPAEVIAPAEVAAPTVPAEPPQPDDSLLAETRMPEPTLPPETTEGPVASTIETEAAVETIPVTETVTADETAAVVEAEAPIEVRRARRTDMDALGIALAKVENRPEPLQRAELLKRAGERGYRIAVSGDSIIALAAWQAENLVAVTREVWAESARAGERALPPLFGLIEHDASELQCEASIVLVNPLTPEFVLDLIRSSNYQLRPVTTLNRIWRQIAEERAQPGDSVWVKRLREDLVTKPI